MTNLCDPEVGTEAVVGGDVGAASVGGGGAEAVGWLGEGLASVSSMDSWRQGCRLRKLLRLNLGVVMSSAEADRTIDLGTLRPPAEPAAEPDPASAASSLSEL